MDIEFDPEKRLRTLQNRGLDFADAGMLFDGLHATAPDGRFEYGELRLITAGYLKDRFVVLVWTRRGRRRRIISMRYGHAEEEELWRKDMERSR